MSELYYDGFNRAEAMRIRKMLETSQSERSRDAAKLLAPDRWRAVAARPDMIHNIRLLYTAEKERRVGFVKVRFYSKKKGTSAGIVLTSDKVKEDKIYEISRLFPYSEAPKMERLEVSPEYATWQEAFEHEFANE